VPRTAVLFGGPSPEHDVSILTGLTAARALAEAGREVEAIYWSKAGRFSAVDAALEASAFADGVPRGARPLALELGEGGGFVAEGKGLGRKRAVLDLEVVVNCCHGGPGEDGTVQGALDIAGIRYTGPSVAGAALGMDKLAFAAVAQAAGLPHLPVAALDPDGPAPFDGPYIVKPRFGGSSIGIEVLADWASVSAYARSPQPHLRAGAVVEPYRAGAVDLEVAIRRHPALALSPISKPASKGAIFDYREKYVPGEGMAAAPRETPADLPAPVTGAIRAAAERVAVLAAVRGVARLDFLLLDGGEVVVNELNTIPGSLTKHLWVDPPVPFATLLADMIAEATTGPGRAYSTQGADGSILRSAASIASKLG